MSLVSYNRARSYWNTAKQYAPYIVKGAQFASAYQPEIQDMTRRSVNYVKRKAKAFKRKAPASKRQKTENLRNDAEADIGYGQHDARSFRVGRGPRRSRGYSRRQRFRKRVKTALRKPQKLAVRRIIRKVGQVNTKVSTTQFNNLCEFTNSADQQGIYIFASGLCCWPGLTVAQHVHGNALEDIMQQQFATPAMYPAGATEGQKSQLFDKFKIRLIGMHNQMTVFSESIHNVSLDFYVMKCKKSISKAEVSASGNVDSLYGIAGGVMATLGDMWNSVPFEPVKKLTTALGAGFDTRHSSTVGWTPDTHPITKKWWRIVKHERFEMQPSQKIVLFDERKLGITLNGKTAGNYAALKNITHLYFFIIRGNPYTATGVQHSSVANPSGAALTAAQECVFKWQPVYNGLDTLNSSELINAESTDTVQDATTAEPTTVLNI